MRFFRPFLLALTLMGLIEASAATYTVKSGDTLYRVAVNHGLSADDLLEFNQLSSATINVGQVLQLPSGAKGTQTAAAPAKAPAPAPSAGRANIRTASMASLNIKYVLGGNSNNSLDCSSFTQRTFASLGIRLPRTSYEQSRVGAQVNRSDLREGDLVFFDTMGAGRVTHVGIYLGNGEMINANSYKGKVVIEPLFSNAYWASRYLGARRVMS